MENDLSGDRPPASFADRFDCERGEATSRRVALFAGIRPFVLADT
jgi:hypothetical protein